jgi:hypothetical protein
MDEVTFSGLAFPNLLGGGTAPLSPFHRTVPYLKGAKPFLKADLKSCDITEIKMLTR